MASRRAAMCGEGRAAGTRVSMPSSEHKARLAAPLGRDGACEDWAGTRELRGAAPRAGTERLRAGVEEARQKAWGAQERGRERGERGERWERGE